MTVPIHPARGEMTQGTKPRRRWRAGALSAAESYPTSEVRDSGPECQAATAQERPGGATQARGQGRRPGGATQRPRPVAAGRRHLMPEARRGDLEEPPRA